MQIRGISAGVYHGAGRRQLQRSFGGEPLHRAERLIWRASMAAIDGREDRDMKATFVPGIEEEQTITTTPEMGITHLGPSVPSMYSTPSMVSLIEMTCVRLISRHVDEGEQSVGYRVNVKHLKPTTIGKQVTAKVALREVNGRRCTFDVEVHNEDGDKIGEGEHERAVIEIARFAGNRG
jgi:predicted thioesterase